MNDIWLQEELEKMQKERKRPQCGCRQPGIEMYIAKVNGWYIVKRMPGTGGLHDPACDHYEPPPELSGLGEVMGTAIKENTEDGTTELKFSFSLAKVPGRKTAASTGAESDSVKTDGKKLTLRSLLHFLWGEAGFNRWTPNMDGKRKWGTIQKHLYAAAANKMVKGGPLSERLFIPETFILDKRDEINQRRLAKISKLGGAQGGAQDLMIIVGEVKELGPARYGHKIVVKHLSDMHLMLNDDIFKRLEKRFKEELALASSFEDAHLMMIATAGVSSSGVASLDEVALMVVTENWIPIETVFDKQLIEIFTATNRRFTKGLRFNLMSTKPLACVVLTDTKPKPTAMYIIPPNAGDDFSEELDELIKESHLDSWRWNAAGSMPKIPGVDKGGAP